MYTPNHKSIRIAISAFVIIISQAFGGLTAAQAAGFSSTFNNAASAVGWSAVNGAWGLTGSNYYYSRGVPGNFASAKHTGAYGDLTYTVRMIRRSSDTGSAQYIIIRGNPLSLNTTKNWKTSYRFGYSNSGYFSVWRGNPNGTVTSLKSWTPSATIAKNGWNILKVVAVGTSLKFYINNVLVYSGADSAYKTGQVGFNFYRDTKSTGNILYVDYAILSTTPTSSSNTTKWLGTWLYPSPPYFETGWRYILNNNIATNKIDRLGYAQLYQYYRLGGGWVPFNFTQDIIKWRIEKASLVISAPTLPTRTYRIVRDQKVGNRTFHFVLDPINSRYESAFIQCLISSCSDIPKLSK